MRELLAKFQRIIVETASKSDEEVARAIDGMYNELLSEATKSYENGKSIFWPMIDAMEFNREACLEYQLCQFEHLLDQLLNTIKAEDDPNLNNFFQTKNVTGYDFQSIRSKLKRDETKCLHEVTSALTNSLNREEKEKLFLQSIYTVLYHGELLNESEKLINGTLNLLFYNRSIALEYKDELLPYFYHSMFNTIDRIQKTGLPQDARDLAEELLVCGYKDDMLHYAYLEKMRLFATQYNIIASLLFANSLMYSLKDKKTCPKQFYLEMLLSILRMYRAVAVVNKKHAMNVDRIKVCFESLKESSKGKISFYLTYYSLRIYYLDKSIELEIEDFVDKNIDEIKKDPANAAVSYYSLIANIAKVKKGKISPRLKKNLGILQSITPAKQKDSFLINIINKTNTFDSLKKYLKKLYATRHIEDYNKDCLYATVLARQMLPESFQEKSVVKMLLAMSVLNDFSFVRQMESQIDKIGPLSFFQEKPVEINGLYEDEKKIASYFENVKDDSFIWIAEGEQGTYITTEYNQNFEFVFLENVCSADFRASKTSIQSKLEFKTYDEVFHCCKEITTFESEADVIIQGLRASYFDFPHAQRLMFAKDSSYAFYPHQLFFNPKTNRLYAENCPTANFISTEFFLQNIGKRKINGLLTKAFWCPKALDMALEQSYSHLSNILENFKIEVYAEKSQLNDYYPIKPLNSSINILCAHGNEKGKDAYCFSAGDVKFSNLNKIVGKGELLILFVCHSGSMDNSNFDNAIHTMIKTFIRAGYQTVIAPMWALSTEILPNWLETFMTRFEEGDFVVDALYKANMAVKEKYPTPSAWANLHLFGNPYLHVQK
ncbi:hypothetical protein B7988_13995 [Fibrobacter sp. UWB1]|uniref:hypothetical protein n=1 Tax=Fibrobacter sp. UWB1 TaxID=1964355 RepID=UPI000B5264C5|nr:hypothetical protein [Fibrobacter sp. UWB1]OWV24799.1 hypothetical protein B7988_13995 [Fibrobacter sp. UWB1]